MKKKNYTYKDVINACERHWNEIEFELEKSKNPLAFFLAGQSASGKGTLKHFMADGFLVIDVDDFRKYHPNFFNLYKKYGKESAKYTHDFASAVADELILKGIENKVDIFIDGTLKSFVSPAKQAELLNENGYVCEVVAVATKPEKSALANLMRYEEMLERKMIPRLAPPEVHDRCVKNFPSTISKLLETKLVKKVRIFNRDMKLMYNSEKNELSPKQFIEKEFRRKWTKEEFSEFLKLEEKLYSKMEERNAEPIEFEIAKFEIKNLKEKIIVEEQKVKRYTEKGKYIKMKNR